MRKKVAYLITVLLNLIIFIAVNPKSISASCWNLSSLPAQERACLDDPEYYGVAACPNVDGDDYCCDTEADCTKLRSKPPICSDQGGGTASCVPSSYVCLTTYGQYDCRDNYVCGKTCAPPTNNDYPDTDPKTNTDTNKSKKPSSNYSGILCNQVTTLPAEFHSLRPYPDNVQCVSSVSSMASYCGNDLTLTNNIQVSYPGTTYNKCVREGSLVFCSYTVSPTLSITIDLSGAELPILGNTEDVVNSQQEADVPTFTDSYKMSEYVSWYLNGVTNRKEYPEKTDNDTVINYSGPLAKLVPLEIQYASRSAQVKNAKIVRHDQIVVCEDNVIHSDLIPKPLKWALEKLGFGTPTAVSCKTGTSMRLSDWQGTLSIFSTLYNAFDSSVSQLVNLFASLFPSVGQNLITQAIVSNLEDNMVWNSRTPPLSWEKNPATGKPFDELSYRKAYYEWEGKSCIMIRSLNLVLCLENYLIPNIYSDLFSYIPMSSTEDVEGQVMIENASSATNPTVNGVTVSRVTFSNQTPSTIHLSHVEETDQLSSLLQDTYAPYGVNKTSSPTNISESSCSTVEVRTNDGDNLFAKQISGDLAYTANFTCQYDYLYCDSSFKKECEIDSNYKCQKSKNGGTCVKSSDYVENPVQTCTRSVNISLSTKTNIPLLDDIWSRLVAGSMSIFKRIFPKTNTEGSVGQIMDIAGSTAITYSANSSSMVVNGATVTNDTSKTTTDLKLPHLGGVSEYFLHGIQTALRPKGYGTSLSFALNSKQNSCDASGKKIPTLPTASGECSLTKTNGIEVPDKLKSIIEAAAQTYKVPASLILAVMYGEGAFNPGRYEWTDENVIAWSTECGKMPNCNSGSFPSQGAIGFSQSVWKDYKDAVKSVDSGREPDPCNLMDIIFAAANHLHHGVSGSAQFTGLSCYGIELNSGTTAPSSCSWSNNDIETAIRVWELGYKYNATLTCYTTPGSCLGGNSISPCEYNWSTETGDNCEKVGGSNNSSHNACVWNVAKGQ